MFQAKFDIEPVIATLHGHFKEAILDRDSERLCGARYGLGMGGMVSFQGRRFGPELW